MMKIYLYKKSVQNAFIKAIKLWEECFHVKVQLPDGERINLNEDLTIEEKLSIVFELTKQWRHITDDKKNKNSNSVIFFLDGLANYLVWHKEEEEKNKQDKEVLSIKKVEQMVGKRKGNSVPFSSLSVTQRENLGLDGDSKWQRKS